LKNKFLIFILIVLVLVVSIGYYFYTPNINEKDIAYFESAKDSIIKNHEYFMTHHIGQSVNSSDKIVFTKQRDDFGTNEYYFDLLKRKEGSKTFFNPINILYNKNLVSDANDKYSVSNSLHINKDSTIQFIIYQKPHFEGYKIGYLLYDPKYKLKIEEGYGRYDVKFEKNGWRYIKAVEPYLIND
jgi:hypothetical protein